MSYTALYRRFRPLKFSDMYGQEHITTTLKNQIMNDRIGHAYLFSGGRGTGKTSSAKILSRAVNCLNPYNGEPCNECEICKGILSGSITDVVEMDAASNNSVENIRQIREEVAFLPTQTKYRVYIIDEVHMLSTCAFNALLKTLEEPPAHVIFILATTEPQKLPATILSRCQRFDYKRIPVDEIKKCLTMICKETNLNIEDDALDMIAVLAEGALRDAISILERCILDGDDKVTLKKIKDLVGIPDSSYIYNLVKGILKSDVIEALKAFNDVVQSGKDINNFLWETIKYLRDILVYISTKQLSFYSEQEKLQIDELSNLTDKQRIIHIINVLSETGNNIKKSQMQTIIFETDIIKLCNSNIASDLRELASKVKKIEEMLMSKNMQNYIINNQKIETHEKIKDYSSDKIKNNATNKSSINKNSNKTSYLQEWGEIVNDLKNAGKIMLYTNLLNTKARQLNDLVIGIEFPKRFI